MFVLHMQVMKASFWVLLEITVLGVLLVQSMVSFLSVFVSVLNLP